tara:strand:+ start:1275 stop:11633 length:10359 start_codon:yes stop_codon:yes gene_type:complete
MLNIDKEQLEQSHRMFVSTGYDGTLEQFSELMKNNPAALNDMFGLYVEAGYRDSKDAYAELIGAKPPATVKKKVVTESSGEGGSLDSSETDGSPIQNPTEAELEELLQAPNTQAQEPIGMYPDSSEVDAYGQQEIASAGTQIEELRAENEIYQQQRPEDMANYLAEEQEQKNLEAKQRQDSLLLQQEGDAFQQDLSVINTELIKQDEETAIALLRDRFLKYGFTFEQTGMGDAVIVSNFNGTATETIDLQPFMSSSEVLESKKLKDFIANNAKQEYQDNEFEDLAFQSDKAQNLRVAPRINEDGTESTVLMTDYEANGRFYAIPTLFPKDPSFYGSKPKDWMELDFEEAKKLAEERGEVFEFKTAEEAAKFAEGSWKDTHATNVIGKQLYSEAGLNFTAEDDKYQQYLKARDTRIFLDEQVDDLGRDLISELTPEEKELYGGYYVSGVLRDDASQVAKEQREIENELYLEVNTEEKIKLREEFDLKTHKKYEALSQKAAKENRQLLFAQDELEVLSLKEFGVPVKDLYNVVPTNETQAELIDDLRIQAKSINVERQHAADLYETSKTFYSAKYDKSITQDMEDGASAVYGELRAGLNDGNASEVILQLSTGMPFDFQNLDINNEEDVKKAAEMISALKGKNQGRKQSRQLSRWNRATGFRESLDAFNANPFETAFVMAINSIGMMLPYGTELVAAGTVAGGGIGAGVGAAGGVGVGAVPGAIFGMRQGMKTGMAMTSFAMEYTNEFFAAMEDKGLDVLNPQDVVKAINDPEIWATAKERGIKRGVPIALVDFITAGAAGRVFKVGKTASRTKKVVSQVAERLVVDPLTEMTGEGLAQINVGDELDFKEIAAEGIGGFGNNTSSMIVNKVMDIKKMSKIELASKLTELDFIAQELTQESDTRVSAWTNNMLELGQINPDQAQRIQKNLGLSKDADNMLDFGIGKNNEKNTLVKTRLMQLLSAKEEYSADTNRKEVFGQKIKDINAEISFLIENKKLAPENIKAKIEAVFSPGVETTDTRQALSQYVIDGKTYSRSEFLKKLGRMNARQLTQFNGKVANDKEVTNILNEKLDAVQIRETESVDAREQTEDSTGVGEGVSIEETPGVETTETKQLVFKNPDEAAISPEQRNIFGDTHTDKRLPGKAAIKEITDADEQGVATATYVNQETGVVDAIISSTDENNFVGYVRVYEDGKATNMFSAKMESTGTAFKNMITSAEATLPDNSEVVETSSISVGGLKSFNKSNMDTKVDSDGNVVTRKTAYSNATKESVAEKGQEAYNNYSTTELVEAEAELAKIEAAYPGITATINKKKSPPSPPPRPGEKKVPRKPNTYSIDIDLPVMVKSKASTKTTTDTKTKAETIVAVAPFFDTTIKTVEDAVALRKTKEYQAYKENLTAIGEQLGVEVEIEEGIGGYKNDAGKEIVEISTRVVLKDASIEQAQEYAAISAALAPETQESSIAAEYVEEGSKNHNGNEYVLTVSDSQGVINALEKAGITDFSINEDTGEVSFINIFEFDNPELQDKIGIFVEELEANNITYDKQSYRPVNSIYVDQGKRKEILRSSASKRSQDRQTGGDLYSTLLKAIENDSKFEGVTTEEYYSGFEELKASETAAAQEVADLEADLESEFENDANVDFKLKEEQSKEGFTDVNEIVEAMSEDTDGAVVEITETNPNAPKIDVQELNERLKENGGRPLPIVTIDVIDGIPTMFSISDQLRTGNVVNPSTGKVIKNLKGGLGFNGVKGHENLAWASIDNNTVKGQISTATKIYNNNKELFKNWWAANPEYNGLVPMSIVKMESSSILSNEAVVRVMADNVASFPKAQRVEALNVFRERLETKKTKLQEAVKNGVGLTGKAVKPGTLKQYADDIKAIEDVQKMDKKVKAKTIDGLLTPKALENLKAITSVNVITGNLGYGQPNSPGKKKTTPGTPVNPVAKALVGDNPSAESKAKLHIGSITDVLTEPQLKDTPIRSVFTITGIDVLNPGIEKTNHPNYPVGPRGKIIGVIEQPQSMLELFPSAYNNAVVGKARENAGQNRKRSDGTRLNETIPVGMGMTNREFQGTIVGVTEEGRLLDFMNRSFPFVNISTDQATMNQLLESPDVTAYLRGDTVVYGMTKDGNIFINKDVHDSKSELYNTAIHEMGHVWVKHLSLTPKGKKIYKRGAEIVQQTELYKKLLKRFDGDVNKATEEAMATLIGNRGESVVDASLKQQVKDWITAVWDYVRQEFKLSKDLTTQEIQDLTMDEFLGTAMADIFSGKPIKLTDAQLKTFSTELKEAMLKSDQSMNSIIETGRRNGFSDASIKAVLKGRKFPAADIAAAMEVKVDAFTQLPDAFGRVESGVQDGIKLFSEVREALSNFASKGKTMAEVRQKAMDLMKANPIYQAQPEQTQMELLVDFDKTLNSRSNVTVQKEIAAIKNNLRQRKINEKNLKASQTQLKNFIRKSLPKSKTYTQAQINNLISRVGKSTVDTFQADTEYVMNVVEKQQQKMKKALVKDMLKLVKSKAMTAFTKSGKRRAKGLSKEGQSYFSAVKQVLMADADTLLEIQQKIQENSVEISNLIQRQLDLKALTKADQKTEAGKDLVKKLTLDQKEQALLNLALAFDSFGGVSNMNLEEVQELMQQVKDVRAESIAVFKSRRLARAEANRKMEEEADNQIKDTNPILFDKDGNVLNKNERDARKNEILSHFRNFEIGKGLSTLAESMKFTTASEYIKNFKLMLQHLGTLSNTLDRVTRGKDFFTKNVYAALNRMDDINNGGVFQTREKLDNIANTIPGITKGVREIYSKLNTGVHKLKLKRSDTGNEYTDIFSADELMRIYALSLNDIQRAKLEAQGITPEVIENIKSIIGTEAVEFTEKSVDFLSNEYYESVNEVYSYVNDVNLGYVNNYFPTSTLSVNSEKMGKLLDGGDFNGVFNAEAAPAFKERVDTTSDVELHAGSFTSVLNNHVETMEKYKAYAVGTQRLNNLFKIKSVQALLTSTGVDSAVKRAVNFAINPDAGKDASGTVKFISKLQSKFTGFALAFKAVQIIKQATSFVNAFEDYSYFPEGSKVPRVIRKAVDYPMFMIDGAANVLSLAKDLVGMKGPVRQAMEISPTFRKRIEQGLEGDVYGLESGAQTFKKKELTGSQRKKIQAKFKTAAAAPTVIGDVLGVMGYMINYKRNIKNGMSKAEALAAFNNYNPTQQSRRGTDKIPLQMNGNAFQRAFTMFGSTLFLQINKVMSSTTNITRSISKGKMPRSKDTRALALNMMVANVLFVGASNIAKFVKGDDEDKEAALKKMGEAMMGLNLIYQLPFVGSAIEGFDVAGRAIAGINGEEYKQEGLRFSDDVVNPIASVIAKYRKLTKKDVGEVEAALRVITEITIGAQLDPFIGLYNLFGGEDEEMDDATYDVMGISPSYRPKNEGGETYTPMSKTKLKQMFPEMYKDKYGPGGTMEEVEEVKSDIRKMKRDLKKEIYEDF